MLNLRLASVFFTTILGLATFAGCSTTSAPDPMAEAAASGEKPVAMRGDGSFFDGKIAADVAISRGFDRGDKGKGRGGGGPDGAGGGKHGHRGGGGSDSDASNTGLSQNFGGFEGASESEQKEMYEDMVRLALAHRAAGSPMPPVTIRLRLENRGNEPAEIEVLEENSDLGNFAVRPTKLKIAPHEAGIFDPMVSQLGVTSDEIPMKITLRVAGKKDSQTIIVKSLIPPKDVAK